MDDVRPITPVRHPLVEKRVKVPASKSIANREIVLSALGQGRSRLALGPLDPGDDVDAMADAVVALGYRVDRPTRRELAALTVVGGEYKPLRHYYQVEEKTYMVRTPKALRESGALV